MTINPYIRKAQYYETDQMGIIHHANYIKWFEEARGSFLEQIGYSYSKAVEQGLDLAVLEVSCSYKSMVRYGDTVHIFVTVSELAPMRMTVSYRITDAKTGELRTLGTTRHFAYDNRRKRPVSLQKALPELYALFEILYNATPETPDKVSAAPVENSMISFDEVGVFLDDIANGLPREFYRELNGGVNLLPELRLHPESVSGKELYVLGEYHYDPRGLGRYINIYYGSFIRMYAHLPRARQKEELRDTLVHEFTHHLESLAGERGLEIKDAQDLARYKRGVR